MVNRGKALILLKPWSVYRAGSRIEAELGVVEWLVSRGFARYAGDVPDSAPAEAAEMPQDATQPPPAPDTPEPTKPRRGRPPRAGREQKNDR